MQKTLLFFALLIELGFTHRLNRTSTPRPCKRIYPAGFGQDHRSVTEPGQYFRRASAMPKKTQWLPYYYAALAQTWIGWRPDIKDKDANAQKINAYLAKAEAIEKNAEPIAVENMSLPNRCWSTPSHVG